MFGSYAIRSSLGLSGFLIVLMLLGGCAEARFPTASIAERDAYLATQVGNEDLFSVHDWSILKTTFFFSCMCEIRLIDGKLQITSERMSVSEQIIKKEYVPDAVMESEIRNLLYAAFRLFETRERGELSDEVLLKALDKSLYVVAIAKPQHPETGLPVALFDGVNRKTLLKLLQEIQRIHGHLIY